MRDCVTAVLVMTACVFAASAASKLRSRQAYLAFRAGLGEAALVPPPVLPVTAALLAGAEAVLAAALTAAAVAVLAAAPGASWLAGSALAAAAGLMVVLLAGVTVVVRRGTRARCACFGASSQPLGLTHVVRNACLLAVLAGGLAALPLAGGRAAVAGMALAVAGGLVLSLLFIRWDDLTGLFAPMPAERPSPGR